MLKLCKLYACPNGTLGLHLSRAPWDPYPWVSGIQNDSSAQRAGVRNGDTVLEMNGRDVLGQKISQIAEHIGEHWKSGATYITIVIWRNQNENNIGDDEGDNDVVQPENNQHQQQQQHQGINQQSLQKFATCLQHIAQLLECPVCLEVIRPPGWQCCNGHVLCNNCRSRSVKCPVCRVPLGPRGRCLMSDKLFTLLAESFPCDGVRKDNGDAYNNPTSETNKCTPDFHNRPKMATMQPTNPKETTIKVKKTKPVQRQIKRVADEVADDDGIATDGNGIKDDGSECSTDVVKQQLNTAPREVEAKADGSTATTTLTIKSSGNIARVCFRQTTSQEETGKVHHQLNELKSQKEKFFDGTVTMTTNPLAMTSSNRRLNEGEESFARHVEKVKNKASGNGYADNNGAVTVQQQRWASKLLVNKENNNSNIKEDVKLKLKSNEKSTDCLMDNCGGNNFKFIAVNNDNGDHKCTVIRINAKC